MPALAPEASCPRCHAAPRGTRGRGIGAWCSACVDLVYGARNDLLTRATAQVERESGVPAAEWRAGVAGVAQRARVTRLLLEWAVERGELPASALSRRLEGDSHAHRLQDALAGLTRTAA